MSCDRKSPVVAAAASFTLSALCVGSPAFGQAGGSGTSNDRVSLPGGPGSLEGVGENVGINPNMGQMSHSVPIKVPEGYPGMTPQIALSYSSGNGGSVVGMGWTLDFPYIERMTVRGLPRYARDDRFTADGSEHLVRVADGEAPVYRSRYENGFVRYTWRSAGDGKEGYWTAEHPDGKIGTYGADASGTLVASARVSGAGGTFRYHLVELTDRYGHRIRYNYAKNGDVTLVERIGWAHAGEGGKALYEAVFEYESRSESLSDEPEPRYDHLSDCKAGFNELLEVRLAAINVFSRSERTRRYRLTYESYRTSGGFTRLAEVQMYGLGDKPYPVHESFEYSQALGAQCTAAEPCKKPHLVGMGTLGVDLGAGHTTLVDINGDALPDVVDTSQPGAHRFWLSTLKPGGAHQFAEAKYSAVGTKSSHDLGTPNVQVLDVNGDGFTDLLNRQTGQVLVNEGKGDWSLGPNAVCGDSCLPDMAADFDLQDGELRTIRFMDYDNDKRIDVVKSMGSGTANVTMVYRNNGGGSFARDEKVEAIGAGFEDDRLELDDMNGDGLLDAIQVTQSSLRYRLSLGWGKWAPWVEIGGFSFTDQEAVQADLEDINGDGLADLVLVSGNEVRYWLNRNGARFDAERKLTSADLNTAIPERTSSVKVLYADMNGNGSHDIVWVSSSGGVTYLELFPVRPNLLSRIKNGLGKVTEVTYRPSVEFQADDLERGANWKHPLPHPMVLVSQTDEWDELTPQVHQGVSYTYHEGFYDGAEKQFRGYERVEEDQAGDQSSERSKQLDEYDVGAKDPYFFGLLLSQETRGEGERSIHRVANEYEECRLTGVPTTGLDFAVRHVCLKRETTEQREGVDPNQWATVRRELTYDGYGNVTLEANLGVVAIGGGACASCAQAEYTGTPCGAECLGDEQYRSFQYTQPESNGDRWLLRNVVRERTYGKAAADGSPANSSYAETLTYYDGPGFEGLPLGQVDRGSVTRVTQRVNAAGDVVAAVRNKLDQHGNVVETLDALGRPGGDEHRHVYSFDEAGLKVVRTEYLLEDAAGPYALRQDVQYDPNWDAIIESGNWQLVRSGATTDARNSTFYAYDEFGRLVSRTLPGEAKGFTSEEYSYDLKSPKSRIHYRMRSKAGGELDLSKVLCFDGHGRQYQDRLKLSSTGDGYVVSGFTVFDKKGHKREVFQPYTGTGAECDPAPPADIHSARMVFDALGRKIKEIVPATAQDGEGEPHTRKVYLPLATVEYDLEDTKPTGAPANTPTTQRYNGLGALIAVERLLTAAGAPAAHTYRYDQLGHPVGWTDPAGHWHAEEHDLLGRVVKVQDPDRGVFSLGYDDVGNRVSETDARGILRRAAFDGMNRLLAKWKDGEEAATKVSYTYDAASGCPASQCTNLAGRIAVVTYPLGAGVTGEDRYGWDARGRDIYLGRRVGDRVFGFGTEYDNAGRVLATTDPTGLRLSMALDGANRIVGIPGFIELLTYDPRGSLAGMKLKNGAVTTRTHDERQRLSSLSVKTRDGEPLLEYAISRDRVGHVIGIADGRADDGTPMGGARYTLDGLYRLTEARLDSDRAAHAETLKMAYDALDNITSMTSDKGASSPANVGTYSYGSAAGPRAVTKAGAISYGYDKTGQMISRGESTFTWDAFGRMVEASRGGETAASFAYGPEEDRLILREPTGFTYYLTPGFEVQDGVAVTYIRVDKDRVVERALPAFAATFLSDLAPVQGADMDLAARPDGAITAADAWISQATKSGALGFASAMKGSDVEELLSASAQRSLVGTAERVRYLHHDQIGSIVALTDANGALAGRMETYPYGAVRFASGASSTYGFTGKAQDPSTGLIYFGARYLDPLAGRWTSADPLFGLVSRKAFEEPGEATAAYGYVGGNPASYSDIRGLLRTFKSPHAKDGGTPGSGISDHAAEAMTARWLGLMGDRTKNSEDRRQALQLEDAWVHESFSRSAGAQLQKRIGAYATHERARETASVLGVRLGAAQPVFGTHLEASASNKRLIARGGVHHILFNSSNENVFDPHFRMVATFSRTGRDGKERTYFFDPNLGEYVFNKATAAKEIASLLESQYPSHQKVVFLRSLPLEY